MNNLQKYGLLGIKALLSLAFVAAGLAKLAGVEMMVQTYEAIGVGQWFRYVTGLIEIGGAILLWIPGRQLLGSALLFCTMVGATPDENVINCSVGSSVQFSAFPSKGSLARTCPPL